MHGTAQQQQQQHQQQQQRELTGHPTPWAEHHRTGRAGGRAVVAAAAAANVVEPERHKHRQNREQRNSNFWRHDEEERFLHGLRLYGWGSWRRIQSVVQTRSNRQIKSHAQKRMKANPAIREKYAMGCSAAAGSGNGGGAGGGGGGIATTGPRRGRVPNKLLEEDARAMEEVMNAHAATQASAAVGRHDVATDAAVEILSRRRRRREGGEGADDDGANALGDYDPSSQAPRVLPSERGR